MATPDWQHLREDLTALHRAALAAADPAMAVRRSLEVDRGSLVVGEHRVPLESDGRVLLVAFGKASLGMTQAAIEALGDKLNDGVVSHPHGVSPPADWPPSLRTYSAAHPIPDEGSLAAGEAVLELLEGTRSSDVILVLVSGGGSALLEALHPGISLETLRQATRGLQRAGADIFALNTVRRGMSRLKGGGLARAAAPARVVSLLLSDVMGDRPETIASGPTVSSATGPGDAARVLERFGLGDSLASLVSTLREIDAPPPPLQATHVIVGSNRQAAAALRDEAERRGFAAQVLSQYLQGEAREAGRVVGGMGRTIRDVSLPFAPPACLVLGGETTVTVRGSGRGGRNLETALGAAIAIDGAPRTAVLCFGTDGVDGTSRAAGAVATGETIRRARALKLSPDATLGDNDCEPFFEALGDLWVTGPTGTNVNDLAVVLVYP